MRKASQWLAILVVSAMAGKAMAAGATVDVFKVQGQGLLASFDNAQFLTCSDGVTSGLADSSVDVDWINTLINIDGSSTMQSVAFVTVHYVNTCTGDDVMMSGSVLNANGSESTDLAKGHVDAVVPVMTDPDPNTGAFVTSSVTVNLNFAATGPAQTIRDRFHSQGGGIVTMNNFLVSSRPGVATGTAVGTIPLMSGAATFDLIEGQPSASAQLEKDADGSMTIVTKAHQ